MVMIMVAKQSLLLLVLVVLLTLHASSSPLGRKRNLVLIEDSGEDAFDDEEFESARMLDEMLDMAFSFSMSMPPPTPEPTSIESYARQIWADAEAGTYPWKADEPCIEHPTFRFGTEEAYTAMAIAATNVFKDPRLTVAIHDEGMPVNTEANIPMSNCGSLQEFSMFLEDYDDLIAEDVRMELREARLAAGF